ncbi:MAG: 4Fe-4S dicluster domain-containing protein [Acidobacteriaceae bacterium]|nr:4Fe-4S dicluster domain-containing protein [Acidobacteriaceae bacterium]MBV9780669.1 4Fe-4S dicluster domain-containing protein [Acidobacteriaceae bacterium]
MPSYWSAFLRGFLLALIIFSIWMFWSRFGKVVHHILRTRRDADFRLAPVSRRVWDFFWEVLCQAKVIRERPLPGIAHAFVFWAFCAFALVTLNHLATGLGFPFFRYHSPFGAFYFWFAFVFAALCAVSIAALAFRRFVLRPGWLGPLSRESGVIALLIFILMITYMPAWWIPETSAAGRALWWIHTLTLLAFFPLIPHTKHLHLILSPVTIFLKRDGFSHIPPLANDEDFGLVSGKDFTRITALQAYSCVECGRCTEHCPANNTGKELNPKLIALGVRTYLNEFGETSETPILSATVSQRAIFQCTTCGACEYQCPVGIQHLPMIIGLRRGAVNTGAWEDDYGTKLFLNLERNGNAMGFSQNEREKFIARQEFPIFDGSQEYCLWLGCMGAYDPNGREIISSFASLMKHLGVSFGVLKYERCTGDPVRRLGNDLAFGQLAETNLEAIQQAGAKKIVSICPHCVRTMAEDWREFGSAVAIEHHSEFLSRHADQLPGDGTGSRVVFHDPCYLGRYRGIYDEPRQVIAKSATVIDPPRARQRSFCCGAGGGLVFLGEETGQRVNEARAKELVETGADTIGAACPFCNSMFRDALSKSENAPKLLDIAQIAAAGLNRM